MKEAKKLLPAIFLLAFGFSANAQISFTTGLKSWFPMNGDFYNVTGNCQYHPDFTTATFTSDPDGIAGDAATFTGSTRLRYLNGLVDADMANFSIDFWFSSTSSSTEPLYSEQVSGGQGVWIRMEPGSNRIHAYLGNSTTFNNVYTTGAYNDGNWHHVVLTAQSGNTAKLYVDGTLNGSSVQAWNTTATNTRTKIGTDDALTMYLNGNMDNVRVWNRPLTSAEVTDLYNAPRISITSVSSATLCAGSSATLSFTVSGGSGAFQGGNVFYAQISDPQGSFIYPLNIGSAPGTGSGTMTINIPDSVATGSNYHVRIVASDYPVASQNVQLITVNNANAPTGFDLFSDLAIHYPFHGNATDVSGNNINGTIVSGITSSTGHNGNPNTALSFNGSNSQLTIGKTWPINSLDATAKPFTISFWMRQSSTPGTWGYIFSCWDPTPATGLWIGTTSGGKIRFRINGNNYVEGTVSNNNWIQVTAVYSGSNIKLYLNGTQQGGTVTTSGNISIAQNAVMGWEPSTGGYYFTGRLEDFRLYDRALGLQEAQTLYHDGSLAGSNSPLCNGGLLQFDGPTYAGLTYSWSGPSGFSDNVEDPFIANFNPYTETGTYSLTLTLNGCTGSPNTTLVQSTVPPVPSVTSQSFCQGNSVTLSVNGATGGQQYIWYDDPAGTSQIAGNVSSYTYAPATTDTVYVGIYDGTSCYSALSPVVATMNPLPNVTASSSPANGEVCAGNSVTLNGAGAISYTWTGGITDNVSFVPASSGTYTVTGTDANGCSNSATANVTVDPLPSVNFVSSPVNGIVCAGSPVTLTAGGTATSYTWSGGITDNVAFTPASSATYTLTGTDANGCTNTASVSITVNALPNVSVISSPANGMVCAGGQATLSGSGAASYSWSGGITDGVAFTPVSTASYSVTGTDANGCSAAASVTVTVNALPVVGATSSPANGEVCAGNPVTLNGTGAASYSWTGGITDNVSFVPVASGTYTVTGTDINGCSNTATANVTVDPLPSVLFSLNPDLICITAAPVSLSATPAGGIFSGPGITGSSFDPASAGAGSFVLNYSFTDVNGCTGSDTAAVIVDVCTGIATPQNDNELSVVPNPSSGIFRLNAQTGSVYSIYSSTGQLVMSGKTESAATPIDLSAYASGIYYLEVILPGAKNSSGIRLVKQ